MDFAFAGRTDPKLKLQEFKLKSDRFDPTKHEAESCQICILSKWTPIGKQKTSPNAKPRVVLKGQAPPVATKKVTPKKICLKFKQENGPGIPHHCTINNA